MIKVLTKGREINMILVGIYRRNTHHNCEVDLVTTCHACHKAAELPLRLDD